MAFYFVYEGRYVGVPDADLVVKTCAEQKDHSLVKGHAEDTPSVLPIGPLLFGVDGVPQHQLSVHPPGSHELQLGHRYHACDQSVSPLLALVVVAFR